MEINNITNHTFIQDFLEIKALSALYLNQNEISIVLDLNGCILFTVSNFANLIGQTKITGINLSNIGNFKHYSNYINKAIIAIKNGDSRYRLLVSINKAAYLVEFRPIIDPNSEITELISVTFCLYEESNLLIAKFRKSKLSKSVINSRYKFTDIIAKLTKFRQAICYLMAYNYTNLEIANIINQAQNRKQLTSRSAINKQVEIIKTYFPMPSKEALIDLIITLDIHCNLPQLLCQTPIEL